MTDERQIGLADYLAVIWRWKWLVVAGTVACMLVTAVVTFFLPRVYRIEAILDAGDVSGPQVQVIDRLVARLASPVSPTIGPDGKPLVLGAEYRPPFLITIWVETRAPAQAVGALRDVAAAVLGDLSRLGKKQQDDSDAKIALAQTRVEALQRDLQVQVDELRSEAATRLRAARTRLDVVASQMKSLRQERALLEQRAASLRQTIKDLSAVRADALRQDDPARAAALLGELGRAIAAAEADLLRVERELTADIPARLGRLEREEPSHVEAIKALEALTRTLRAGLTTDGPDLDRVRDMVSQAALTGAVDGSNLMAMIRRIEIELLEQIKRFAKETDSLIRDTPSSRAPRLVAPPQEPGVVVRPRRKVALAVSGVVGLVSAIVLAFLVEYLVEAAARRRKVATGRDSGLAEARPAVRRDPA